VKIKEILTQHRRDFTAIYECEHCGAEMKGSGYDDDNYHRNVIPMVKCPRCKKTAKDNYRPLSPKYSENEVV